MYKTLRSSQEVYIHPSSVLFRLARASNFLIIFSPSTRILRFTRAISSYDKLCNLIYVHKPDHFHILWNLRFPFVYKMNLLTMVFWFWWTLSCRVNPKWVIFHSLVSTDRQYMRNVITIDPSWLIEAAPHFYRHRQPNSIPHWKILVAKWGLSPEFTWQESILLPDWPPVAILKLRKLTRIMRITRTLTNLIHGPVNFELIIYMGAAATYWANVQQNLLFLVALKTGLN